MAVLDSSSVDGGGLPRQIILNRTRGDRVFRAMCLAAGMTTLVLLALIGIFLLIRSREALQVGGWKFFTTQLCPRCRRKGNRSASPR